MKQGVESQMDKHSQIEPQWNWAVVFDTTWQPAQPPGGSEWDYDTFFTRAAAEERFREPQTDRFREPELWQRRDGRWGQVADVDPGNPRAPEAATAKRDITATATRKGENHEPE